MSEEKDRDIERLLKNIPPPPLPPGLKQRTLAGMARRNDERSLLSPRLRACFIGSIFVIITAIAGDTLLSRREAVRTEAEYPADSAIDEPTSATDVFAVIPNAERLLEKGNLRHNDKRIRLASKTSNKREFALIEEEIDGLKN